MNNCIFCNISNGAIPTKTAYESAEVIAFADIHPIAPVHFLIVPRQHIMSMNDIEAKHAPIIAEMFAAAVQIAKQCHIADDGYKLLIRTGRHGGQEVPHIHLHMIGGAPLSENIHPIT